MVVVTKYLKPQAGYDVRARHIAGTHDEKLAQIDEAIQELLDIKTIECLEGRPGIRFLAVPRRSHALAMTATILALLIVLILLLGVRTSHAHPALVGVVWWIGNGTRAW